MVGTQRAPGTRAASGNGGAPQSAPDPVKQQTDQKATALAKRLDQKVFALSPTIKEALIEQGATPQQVTTIMAACLASRIPPVLLAYPNNIQPVMRVASSMTRLGYVPGKDFHVAIYGAHSQQYNEYGEPIEGDGAKKREPTVVYMPSVSRLEANAKAAAQLEGIVIHVETTEIEDREEAKKIFDRELGGVASAHWGTEVRVAKAELYKYFKSGTPLGSGKPAIFYGFYLPYKDKSGTKDYLETGKVMANYSPVDIAMKRAAAKAYRAITRDDMPRDDTPVAQRMLSLMDKANTALTSYEQDMTEYGVDINQAIAGDYEIVEEEPVMDMGTAGIDPKAEGPETSTEKQTEISSGPEKTHEAQSAKLNENVLDPVGFMSSLARRVGDGPEMSFCNSIASLCDEGSKPASKTQINAALQGLRFVAEWDADPVPGTGFQKAHLLLTFICQLGVDESPCEKSLKTLNRVTVPEFNGTENPAYSNPENEERRGWIKAIAKSVDEELELVFVENNHELSDEEKIDDALMASALFGE